MEEEAFGIVARDVSERWKGGRKEGEACGAGEISSTKKRRGGRKAEGDEWRKRARGREGGKEKGRKGGRNGLPQESVAVFSRPERGPDGSAAAVSRSEGGRKDEVVERLDTGAGVFFVSECDVCTTAS